MLTSVDRIKWSKTCGFKAKEESENGTEEITEEREGTRKLPTIGESR